MPKYVEERERRHKKHKPIDKLGLKVLKDKISALETRRNHLMNRISAEHDYDSRAQIDSQLFLVNHDLFTLRAALEKKNGNNQAV